MLGNTLVINDGSPRTLVKINQDGYSSEYYLRTATHIYRAFIRHSRTKATTSVPSYDRHNVEFVKTTLAVGAVPEFNEKFYFVDERLAGDTDVTLADAVCDLAIASSNSFLNDIAGWQN